MSLTRLICRNVNLIQSLTRVLCVALVGLAALLAPATNAWQNALSPSEVSVALEVADLSVSVTSLDPTGVKEEAPDQTSGHPLGIQLLIVELKEQKKAVSGQRLAEIFTYNYSRQMAQRHIVDLHQSVLISVQDINSAHLPLSDAEIDYANLLLWDNPEFQQRVSQELLDLQLDPSSILISQTDARVSVWVPGSEERSATSGCRLQRCALFSLYTDNEDSLTIEPVVNLVTGKVYVSILQ